MRWPMKRGPRRQSAESKRGFTLVEVSISITLMGILGYSFVAASDMGNNSYRAVQRATTKARQLRAAGASIVEEFQLANPNTVEVVVLADGNHRVTFQQPLVIGGALLWGAYEPKWGSDEAERNQAGWWIRYTVVNTAVGGGNANMTLIRQVLDDGLAVIEQDEVMEQLSSGFALKPGFSVVDAGEVWEIQVNSEGFGGGDGGNGGTYNVRMRN
jgi:prepilin-type N-terminal cleavage/methylation domain-containing protein